MRVPIFVDREISSRVTPCFSRSSFSWAPNVDTRLFSPFTYMLCECWGRRNFPGRNFGHGLTRIWFLDCPQNGRSIIFDGLGTAENVRSLDCTESLATRTILFRSG